MSEFKLHDDPNFHYETIRSLGLVRYGGGDIGEQIAIMRNIRVRNVEDWYREWHNLAKRVLSTIDESDPSKHSAATLRSAYYRASHYFFVADFFLHGNLNDPRLDESFKLWRAYFDKANALLPIPGVHYTVPTPHGFTIPIIAFRHHDASASDPKPTLLIGGGFDSNYEELMHVFAFPALERGYNVILYEGPGQPRLLHEQNKGFIYDWEKAVTPIFDFVEANKQQDFSYVDTSKIGLVGMSMGGYLAARAAAFEPRIAAVMCIDAVYSMFGTPKSFFPWMMDAYYAGDVEKLNAEFDDESKITNTNLRWFHDQLRFSYRRSPFEIFREMERMTLDGVADKIKCPAFLGDAEGDLFFGDQPKQVKEAIGAKADLVLFGKDQAAAEHCQSGALTYMNQRMLDWFEKVVN